MKPRLKVTGCDVYLDLRRVCLALRKVGREDQVEELTSRVIDAESYEEALRVMGEYAELI